MKISMQIFCGWYSVHAVEGGGAPLRRQLLPPQDGQLPQWRTCGHIRYQYRTSFGFFAIVPFKAEKLKILFQLAKKQEKGIDKILRFL